jgi:hypothetical protein
MPKTLTRVKARYSATTIPIKKFSAYLRREKRHLSSASLLVTKHDNNLQVTIYHEVFGDPKNETFCFLRLKRNLIAILTEFRPVASNLNYHRGSWLQS